MNCLLRNSRRLLLIYKQAAGAVRRSPSLLPPSRSYSYCNSKGSPVLHFDRWYHKPCNVAAVAVLASGAAAMAALAGYDREVVPYTNRTHMVIRSLQSERQLCEPAYTKEKKIWASESRIVDPLHPDSIRVRRIAEKVIRAAYRTLPINNNHDGTSVTKSAKPQTSPLEGLEWEVILVKDDDPNAICSPSGKIAVNTGLLDHFTDAEIAFGIGHEIGHIVARHCSEICYAKWFPVRPFYLPFFRRSEMEADHIGTLLLGAAGFHPYASLLFFRKHAIIERTFGLQDSINFYPSHKTRAKRVLQPKIMDEAMKLYKEAPPDEDTSSQATGEGFSFRQTLGDACKLILTRLRHVITGRSTD